MRIAINNLQKIASVDGALLRRGIRAALSGFAPAAEKGCEVSVALVGDAEIARLHERYMNEPGPTDVISFPLMERVRRRAGGRENKRSASPILGEIVISVETARREAKRRRKSVDSEVLLYAIHGALHLAGHDDRTPGRAAAMKRKEQDILRESSRAGK